MTEYRPEPTELWETIQRHRSLVRRIALAVGGFMVAYAIAHLLTARSSMPACAALGGAILGFFAPAFAGDDE